MTLSISSPLSLYSIPIVWYIAFYPHASKMLLVQQTVGFDNVAPRDNVARLADMNVDSQIVARAARMEAAHANGVENFPLWAIAVVIGNIVGVDHITLNTVTLIYIGLRLLFNYAYINQKTQIQGHMRTFIYISGILQPLYILISAANIARSKQQVN